MKIAWSLLEHPVLFNCPTFFDIATFKNSSDQRSEGSTQQKRMATRKWLLFIVPCQTSLEAKCVCVCSHSTRKPTKRLLDAESRCLLTNNLPV